MIEERIVYFVKEISNLIKVGSVSEKEGGVFCRQSTSITT